MKILQIAERTYPAKGGVEVHTSMISKGLSRRGHEVTLVVFNSLDQRDCGFGLTYQRPFIVTRLYKPTLPRTELWNGVRIIRFPSRAQVFSYYWSPEMLHWLIENISRFDIVHTHCFRFSNNEFTAIAARMNNNRIPTIFTCHDVARLDYMGLPALLLDGVYRRTVGKSLVSSFKRLIALTETNAQEYVKYLFADPEKVRVVPNGVDFDRFQQLPDPSDLRKRLGSPKEVILFIGRFLSYKNPDKLIIAYRDILKKYPKSHLLMIGKDYGMFNYCRRLAGQNVTFLEDASEETKLKALALADLCVVPSAYEGFGIVALEAQAAGVPIIATRSGGLRHALINGLTGLHLQSPTSDNIRDATCYLLDHPELREKMKSESKRFSSSFSWESVAEKLEKVYSELV